VRLSSTGAVEVTGDATVVARHLVHRYAKHVAVDDVSFGVRPGRVTCLLGPNGAGKSTLIHCIVGLISPNEGSVHVGEALCGSRAAAGQLGFVHDDLPLPLTLTGNEVLRLLSCAHELWDVGLEQDLVELLGLVPAMDKMVGQYSHGMKRKLQVIASLGHRPSVWVLDEPFRGLDPVATATLTQLIQGFAAQGGTVLIATHDLVASEQLCDDVIVVSAGRVAAAGSLAEVTRGHTRTLQETYLASTGLAQHVAQTRRAVAALDLDPGWTGASASS
jgi:ABC-2 type transport system ATP-binding protein